MDDFSAGGGGILKVVRTENTAIRSGLPPQGGFNI
jgi:hypothetical protein